MTNNIGTAVKEIKGATRIEYRADKAGVVHLQIGKVNFTDDQIAEEPLVRDRCAVKSEAGDGERQVRGFGDHEQHHGARHSRGYGDRDQSGRYGSLVPSWLLGFKGIVNR